MTAASGEPEDAPAAPWSGPAELWMAQLRAFTELASGRSADTSTAGGGDAADRMMASVRSLAGQANAPTAQLDQLMAELAAKRALIGALQLQLSAFDQQLGTLEDSMRPLQEWARQWTGLQRALTDAFRPPGTSPGQRDDGSGPRAADSGGAEAGPG